MSARHERGRGQPGGCSRMKRGPSTLELAAAVLIVSGLAAAAVFWSWMSLPSVVEVTVRVPGADGAPPESSGTEAETDLAGQFRQFDGTPAQISGAWPRFRGPDFDNIVKDGIPLKDRWPDGEPREAWRVALGEGYAGPVVWNGRVYVLDYDMEAKADAVRCFSLEDGREIWRRSYSVVVKKNHGMSRTVPAVSGDYLVTMGPRCHVVCLDPVSGAFRWGIDLQRDIGANEPLWYTGQCPLIDGNAVVLAPGAPDALLMGVDCATGAPLWKTPNPNGWTMSHSSVMPMTLLGRRMYVYCAIGGAAGVAADGADAGALLWSFPWNARVVAPSPVAVGEDRVFLTAGYGEGGVMLRIKDVNGAYVPEVQYKHGPKDGLASEQQTPIYHDGLLYGIMPKDAGALRSQFVCYEPDGALVWSSGQAHRFGLGPFVLADGKFFVLSDEGELTMLRVSRSGYEELGKARVLTGHDAWGPLAVAGGRMLLRDLSQMVCVVVGTEG